MAALFVVGVGAAWTHPVTAPAGGPAPALASRAEPPAAQDVAPAAVAEAPPVPPSPPSPPADQPPPRPVAEAVMAPPPPVFDAPPPPLSPPPAAVPDRRVATTPPAGGTWAVIIGIDDYPGERSDLRSAVNDAADVDQALGAMGVPVENRLVLRDRQATADRIRESIDWLASRAAPEATAVFFYGGHVRKLGAATEAVVASDGNMISDRELGERLSHVRAGRAWIAMASCYGGGFTEVLGPGRVLTGAAPADALAYETTQYGRSYLVQYMVREAMIENRASASVQAAFAYAVTELARRHPTRLPVQIDVGAGPLDLRPVLAPAAAPVQGSTAPLPAPPTTVPCRRLLLLSC